jgi:hypothetical protein
LISQIISQSKSEFIAGRDFFYFKHFIIAVEFIGELLRRKIVSEVYVFSIVDLLLAININYSFLTLVTVSFNFNICLNFI